MRMKGKARFAVFIFLLCNVFLLGSCGTNNAGNGEKIEVEFFNQKAEIADGLRNAATEYEKENPNVDMTITTVTSNDGGASLLSKFTSKREPTMMMLSGLPDVDFYKDYLYEMDDLSLTDEMLPQLLESGQLEGKQLGMPFGVEGFGFLYNKEIFKKAGINPNNIKSYQDFVNVVELLDDKKEALGLEDVFAFEGEDENVANHFFANFSASEFDDDNNQAFNAKELKWQNGKRMHEYTDLINQHTVQPVITMNHTHSVDDLFFNDKVAMVHQGNWIVPALNKMDPAFVQEKLGLLPIFADDDKGGRNVAGTNWVIGINKNKSEEEIKAAAGFLDFLYISEKGQKIVLEELQVIPPVKDLDIDKIGAPISRQLYQDVLDNKAAPMTYKQEPYGFLRASLAPNYQKYLAGEIGWNEFEKLTSEDFREMRRVQKADE
ncbi:ABC transporter substrate-binding protein [Tetragenococcus koreensis]|uniref:Sugar ABC transporter substrate-binding protein n=1 Tax=Tetragenococcus koreensis TaxID=290335 RepID=A0AAN4UB74_9ENTE|nr:extracellular solute-binding protein [Tetragenococcus koreensis]MCF1584869.1 extracellular solute-binding protein [Tetragenococcus koreensis]MCF1614383.1 extracellular solute-binding protein [Tetragenococcus koreensis]MCF1616991.1 extracellular solute-binding protein [Tetragenococcus koreensis]MCF1621933.1 extracellular solute-binding protein [Tetragenococcus koreensis]MCF1624262.1 extracellular solute-binding protein [Tetragenococcus koreensis]